MKRSQHNLSHSRGLTGNLGQLLPIGVVEVLPGDTFRHSTSMLLRVATILAPLMHPVHVRVHSFFVPNRLVYPEWDTFITGKDDTPTFPTITIPTANHTELTDHLGIPNVNNIVVSALPIRAYNMIWNHYYRDQDLHTEVSLDSLALQRACWPKDYFTTARTHPQFGDTAVTIPFSAGSEAPVSGFPTKLNVRGIGVDATTITWDITDGRTVRETPNVNTTSANTDGNRWTSGSDILVRQGSPTTHPDVHIPGSAFTGITADLSAISGAGIDINDLRTAFGMQRFLEARNRYGSRYVDYLRYLGVRPSDGRLDEPEYLGGGKQTVAFSEVLATAEGTNTEVGDMAGHGIAGLRTRPYRRFFEEHGHVVTLLSVLPKGIYAQQLHRAWLRRTKDDFWQKEYEMFGPQPIFTREIYGAHANATDVFGYTDRHREYREHPSYNTGKFRVGQNADHWHLAREFSSSPTLNDTFVTCTPRTDVFAAPSEVQLYIQANHRIAARRLVSATARA